MSNKAKHRVPQATAAKGAMMEADTIPGDPPAYQEIAALAFSYWEARGHQGGSAEEDWLRAEGELRTRHAAMRTPKEARAAKKSTGALPLSSGKAQQNRNPPRLARTN